MNRTTARPSPLRSRLAAAGTAALLLPGVIPSALAGEVTVARFSPEGSVKQVQQATARFSAAMVPFGDLTDVAPPFETDCASKGSSRWIDSVTWAFDFARQLPSGVRCTFTLRPDLRAQDGAKVGGRGSFTFTTGGPAVTQTRPWAGDTTIDERQVFLLSLDGDVEEASVREAAGFVVEGLPERIEADILAGAELQSLLAGMSKWSRPAPPMIALRARRTFPNAKKVRLEWGAGIRSPSGERTTTAQTFEYTTRGEFAASAGCRRENARSGCVPIKPITVEFTAPVAAQVAGAIRLVGPDGKESAPAPPTDSEANAEFTSSVLFAGPFAENATYTVRLPDDLRDDAGRALPAGQARGLTVRTGPLPVLAKFATNFGILERNAEPALPITLRNIETSVQGTGTRPVAPQDAGALAQLYAKVQGTDLRVAGDDPKKILEWLRRVSGASRRRSLFGDADGDGERTRFTIPKPAPTREVEVVGLPMTEPGLHIVEIESPLLGAALLGQERPMFVAAAALVTNLAVHFKQGREGSIAWVTTLDHAEPVAGARVVASDCNGTELASAETDADGVARFASLPGENALPSCWRNREGDGTDDWRDFSQVPALSGLDSGLLVVARTEGDMSFVHSSWDSGIEPWRFQLRDAGWQSSPLTVHAIFDRPLLRAGETVHMKFLLRRRSLEGFSIPPAAERPKRAVIEFFATGQRFELPVDFDDSGVATADWPIPADAKLGEYSVSFESAPEVMVSSGAFRVEQFRVPLLRGEISAPPVLPPRSASVNVDVAVRYLAGGAAGKLPVLVRSELRPDVFDAPEDYDGYSFASGGVAEGWADDDETVEEDSGPKPHRRYELELDEAGGARVVVDGLPVVERPTSLVLEAEFRDPNGEVETVSTSRTLLPASCLPGIRVNDWTQVESKLRPQVVVLAPDGRPAAGAPVRIEVSERRWISHRKRLVGGFYGYDSKTETRALGVLCEGTSDDRGLFTCEAAPPAKGQLVLEATVTDPEGHTASTSTEAWVPGEDSGFDTAPDDRIDVVPEQPTWEPGETARLQIRMPFREATALVTIEREGVGEARVVHLRAEDPVVEVPIRGEHAPNVFVSVLLVRGRVGDAQPTAMLDLARPAFKLGVTELRVGWKTHRLDVAVTSDRETYRVREKAKVHVAVTRHDGSAPAAGSEVAVAAVDEGLLELLPNASWDVLEAMMALRGYEVQTSTAQGQVVGKRHYGRKTVAAGGGAYASGARELFDTLLFWSSRVKLDASGQADVEVPLNDSLTGFRIVAIATGGAGEFGDGGATIRTTRELAVYSGLPPLVREGDEFQAEFTLRNTGGKPLDVRASGGVADGESTVADLAEQHARLAPGEGRTITWPVAVPAGHGSLSWTVSAVAEGAEDRLTVRQRVAPANPVAVVQATLEQLDGTATMPVRMPAGADPNAHGSGIAITAANSLADSVDSMKDWLARYPYTCLEQRVSVAIGREDDKAWSAITGELASYLDQEGLLTYFPGERVGDDRLTAYVLSLSLAAGRELPEDVAESMTAALDGFVAGRITRSTGFNFPDRTLRKLAAIEALARAGKASAAMLGSITIQPALWPTSAVLDWWSILARTPDIAGADAKKREVEQVLRARLDLSGTTLVFATEREDALWWMMAGADSNAVRLLLHLAEQGLWKEDAPRVLRGAVARREGGAWETTVANAWGVVAMRRFAKAFEAEPVTGRTEVALAAASASIDWSAATRAPVTLPWPPAQAELTLRQAGSGKPWITTTARAGVPRTEPVAAGYRITKTVTAVEPRGDGRWRRGDRVHVRLDIDAQRAMWWVVVDDPVPAGASHLGGGLGRGASPTIGEDRGPRGEDDVVHPAFVERSQQSWRGYVRYLPRGHSRLEYSIRVNQAGSFHVPPTRVEALYAPEVFGELPNAKMVVDP